jgi:hypothetical protein
MPNKRVLTLPIKSIPVTQDNASKENSPARVSFQTPLKSGPVPTRPSTANYVKTSPPAPKPAWNASHGRDSLAAGMISSFEPEKGHVSKKASPLLAKHKAAAEDVPPIHTKALNHKHPWKPVMRPDHHARFFECSKVTQSSVVDVTPKLTRY